MHFRIITKPGCRFCDQAKALLTLQGHSYSEDLRKTKADIASFKAAGYRTFPQIFEGERHVGGLERLRGYVGGSLRDDF